MTCNSNIVAQMNRRVEIQSLTRTSDSQGGFTEEWNSILAAWAKIEPVKAYEKFQAMQMQVPITHKITMRYNSSITSDKRILYGTRIFNIKEIINVDEANSFLKITASEA